ncbi:MAG: hypothetical protein AAF682_27495 [Planctomycetota bacterium]
MPDPSAVLISAVDATAPWREWDNCRPDATGAFERCVPLAADVEVVVRPASLGIDPVRVDPAMAEVELRYVR